MPNSSKAKKMMAQMMSRISNSLKGARDLISSAGGSLKNKMIFKKNQRFERDMEQSEVVPLTQHGKISWEFIFYLH